MPDDQNAIAGDGSDKWVPYRKAQPRESPPELVVPNAIPTDERIWVPVEENVWFRPLLMCVSRGYWMNLLKVRKSGVLSRHRHPLPVHGYVLKGEWRYLEHDWVAQEGAYVYEAPGETHTLVVDEHVEEMITMFQVNGAMIYVDPDGNTVGYDDVFTRIDKCRAHYAGNGLGEDYIDQFIRQRIFYVNRHIEPKHVVTVMADCPKLFSDLPEIPADAALGEGYTFQP